MGLEISKTFTTSVIKATKAVNDFSAEDLRKELEGLEKISETIQLKIEKEDRDFSQEEKKEQAGACSVHHSASAHRHSGRRLLLLRSLLPADHSLHPGGRCR